VATKNAENVSRFIFDLRPLNIINTSQLQTLTATAAKLFRHSANYLPGKYDPDGGFVVTSAKAESLETAQD
jgi:hypothetical protein